MEISLTDAKAQLTGLVRRAEAGDDIVLTRRGLPAVRLVPVTKRTSREQRRALLEDIGRKGSAKASAGPSAAHSQDFLYNEDGLPR